MKRNNEFIYYSISEIASAIKEQKKIGFYYFKLDMNGKPIRRKSSSDPDKDKRYVVNPVKTINEEGRYYLICYDDKHGKLTQYRIDRMEMVEKLEESITPSIEVETAEVIQHRKTLVGMFGGRLEEVTFVADESVMDSVYDRFGMDVKPYKTIHDKVEFKVNVQISKPLLTWIIGFGKALKATAPKSVVDEIKRLLEEATETYAEK
ncbi:MAG: WYL domain-containing protein [Clostridia bacterium]|nr:WYL domain-containing protein [Clostridia bacterium]